MDVSSGDFAFFAVRFTTVYDDLALCVTSAVWVGLCSASHFAFCVCVGFTFYVGSVFCVGCGVLAIDVGD